MGTSSKVKTRQTKFEPLDLSEMKFNFVIYAQTKETLTPEQAHVLLQDLPKEVRIDIEQKTLRGCSRSTHCTLRGCSRSTHCKHPGSARNWKDRNRCKYGSVVRENTPKQKMHSGFTNEWSQRESSTRMRES